MTRSRLFLLGIAAASVLVLAGCTGVPPQEVDNSPIDISLFQEPVKGALKPYYEQTLTWIPCSHDLTCSTLKVPLDWDDVTAKSTPIALVRHAATGRRIGSLLVDPGGPGGSGVQLIEGGVDDAVDAKVARSYDVIGFDPRGVGASNGVKCLSGGAMDDYVYGVTPGAIGSTKWIAAQKKRSSKFAAACEKNTGPVIGHLDTINAAQDMDVIRQALGESKLNYLGYSYGTLLGTMYAGLHPERVGRTVFDGADDPWSGGNQYGGAFDPDPAARYDFTGDGAVDQAKGFEDELSTYLSNCLSGERGTVGKGKCPFSDDVTVALTKIKGTLVSLDAHPLAGTDGRMLDAATLVTAIDASLYDRGDWIDLTRLFTEVEHGDATTAFRLADEYNGRSHDGSYSDNIDVANLAIGCDESGPTVDLNYDRQELQALTAAAPILGPYEAYGDLTCSGWKYGPVVGISPITARGAGPILIVGTTSDPATPYSEATDLSKQLVSSHLVTYNGDGHTAYDKGDKCIDSAVDSYLLQGVVPGSDPNCR